MNIILGCFMKNIVLQSLWSPFLDVTNSSRLDPLVACSTMSSWLKFLFHYHFVISSPMNLWFCVLASLIILAGNWNVGWHKARFSTELSLSSVLMKLQGCQLPKKSSENINTHFNTTVYLLFLLFLPKGQFCKLTGGQQLVIRQKWISIIW